MSEVASILDVRLVGAETYFVRFQCLSCGSVSERPAKYLVDAYGVETLADVQKRARCLVYRGRPKRRCGGEARVGLASRYHPGGYGNIAPPKMGLDPETPPAGPAARPSRRERRAASMVTTVAAEVLARRDGSSA